VQTFLPYSDFRRSAEVLDDRRLGKQRVETLQVLRALVVPEYGWQRHPAVLMWQGHVDALVVYGLTFVRTWTRRGFADTTHDQIREFAPRSAALSQDELAAAGLLPAWVGDEAVHASHRSALVRKDRERYGPLFPDVGPDLPYVWPSGGDEAPGPAGGHPLWVVRPPTADAQDAMLAHHVIGLDAGSGVAVDASGATEGAVVELLREVAPHRRPGKALRQLVFLLHEMRVGDPVALLLDEGTTLRLGEVVGGYEFVPDAGPRALVHRRQVRWHGSLSRGDVWPPAVLQDPRSLFRVTADPRSLGLAG
jgi:hypothetical protein